MYGVLLYIRFLILLLISSENCCLHLGKRKFILKRLFLCLQTWLIGIYVIAKNKKEYCPCLHRHSTQQTLLILCDG